MLKRSRAGARRPRPTGAASGSFRPDIQGLRTIAVVLVVLDHADIGPFHGGYIGVDVFFVISGFLISSLLFREAEREGRVSLLGFYARRARRILPAASVVLAATVAAGYYLLPFVDALRLLKDSVWAVFFAANIRFAQHGTDYWAQDDATSPIQHYWSLAVEEQFYLVWPLLVLLLAVVGSRSRLRSRAGLLLLIVGLASLAWAVWLTASSPHAAYFSTAARAWELAAGAAVAALLPRLAALPARVRTVGSAAGLLLVGGASVSFGPDTGVPGIAAVVPVLGTVLLLVAGAGEPTAVQKALGTAPMRYVGDRSYSYYLWHWPALVFAGLVWGPSAGWTGPAVAIGALLLADLSYRFVENPFRKSPRGVAEQPAGRWRAGRGSQWRAIALYPASVVALGAVVLVAHTGLVRQFNEPRRPVTLADYGQDGGESRRLSKDPQTALVQASVLAAENDMPIPNPLRPAALGLADHVAADLGGCEYWGLPQPMPLCPRGDVDGDRTLVLVGDSHARHWIPALEPVAAASGYRAFFFVLQGCTPALVQPWSPVTDAPDSDCSTFHDWSQQQIERLHPDVVVMSTDTQRAYVDQNGVKVDDNRGVADLVRQGIADRIRALQPYTERVVVLADPPRLEFNPTVLFERGTTLKDGLSDPLRRSLLMRQAVRRAAVQSGADYVETSQWFCAYDECPVVIGNYITRRDRGHISLEYSASLSGPLGRLLGLGAGVAPDLGAGVGAGIGAGIGANGG